MHTQQRQKNPVAPMGVLSSLLYLRTRDPPLSPPSALAEFFRCTFLQSRFQIFPPTTHKTYQKFQNSTTIFEFLSHPHETARFGFCPSKIGFFRGAGGVPEIFPPLDSSYFCYFGAHAKFQTRSTNPSGRNSPFRLLSAQNRLF